MIWQALKYLLFLLWSPSLVVTRDFWKIYPSKPGGIYSFTLVFCGILHMTTPDQFATASVRRVKNAYRKKKLTRTEQNDSSSYFDCVIPAINPIPKF